MSILKFLGFHTSETVPTEPANETETVRKITRALEAMDPVHARYIAAFAFILSRVANADLEISEEETAAMERIVMQWGHLPEEQAILVVQIAKSQNRLFGGTENFLVTREFKEMATAEQKEELLNCLFAVSASDNSITTREENEIWKIASELGVTDSQYISIRSAYSKQRAVLKDLPGTS